MRVLIRGAGVAGLVLARELVEAGATVTIADPAGPGQGASRFAGGMLAPWCESETAPDSVLALGQSAAGWWARTLPGHVTQAGTLAIAAPRDLGELKRLAQRTTGHRWLDEAGVAALEPALGRRFRTGLFFPGESHLDPRAALGGLVAGLEIDGARLHTGAEAAPFCAEEPPPGFDRIVDCTGAAAIGGAGGEGLRGVRGEMVILETPDVRLSRPVRLMHPRISLYIVPRAGGRFMAGATMIESADASAISSRSLMELLNAAYALHPAFAEARVVETGTGIRPAYDDNLPRLFQTGRHRYTLNGFYRHGFLLAPALAAEAVRTLGVRP